MHGTSAGTASGGAGTREVREIGTGVAVFEQARQIAAEVIEPGQFGPVRENSPAGRGGEEPISGERGIHRESSGEGCRVPPSLPSPDCSSGDRMKLRLLPVRPAILPPWMAAPMMMASPMISEPTAIGSPDRPRNTCRRDGSTDDTRRRARVPEQPLNGPAFRNEPHHEIIQQFVDEPAGRDDEHVQEQDRGAVHEELTTEAQRGVRKPSTGRTQAPARRFCSRYFGVTISHRGSAFRNFSIPLR